MGSMVLSVRAVAAIWLLAGCLRAEEPLTARAIMEKVAANTGSGSEARRQFLYHQKVRSAMLYSNGKLVRRELREYDVIPLADSTDKVLTSFQGEYQKNGKTFTYSAPDDPRRGDAMDASNLASLTDDLTNAKKSRDGIPAQLFTLLAEDLDYYRFTRAGDTSVGGRRAYRISFEPAKAGDVCISTDDGPNERCHNWKGEVVVDAEEFQPVRIATTLARGVPAGIRVFMGINLRQVGFSVSYKRLEKDVWFPTGYGTEIGVTVFWGYKRTITLSLDNNDFRRTGAESTIHFDEP